jgi:hypothetical protein
VLPIIHLSMIKLFHFVVSRFDFLLTFRKFSRDGKFWVKIHLVDDVVCITHYESRSNGFLIASLRGLNEYRIEFSMLGRKSCEE